MPDIVFTPNLHSSGPLFDGRLEHAAEAAADDIEREVAEQANRLIHRRLHEVLKHPTGYYESHVRAEMAGERWKVSDNGVIYGPWLEGTGERNRTTRFKGYATFRRVKAIVNRQAPEIARRVVERHLRRFR